MNRQQLIGQIKTKRSFLCIGLDTDINKIPKHLLKYPDPVLEFNKQVIDATRDLCVAYKPNTAFYECYGSKGWETLEKTIAYIGDDVFSIADAKRGDIGNTSRMYAEAFFSQMDFDSVTVAPYMGEDSVTPFLSFPGKWVILLALTSNQGSADFQTAQISQLTSTGESETRLLFEHVLTASQKWGSKDNMMYVVGATQSPVMFEAVRRLVPHHFLLVPGVGAQGGSLADVARYGMNKDCGLLVNSSRGILYAGDGEDFAEKARSEAMLIQQEMEDLLEKYMK